MSNDENVGSVGMAKRCILGKTNELTSPHLFRVLIVHDAVAWCEATVVEVFVIVDARIIVVGKRCKDRRSFKNRRRGARSRCYATASCNAKSKFCSCHVVLYGILEKHINGSAVESAKSSFSD
jgi:hypothetical protein